MIRHRILSVCILLASAAPAAYAFLPQLGSRPAEDWIERLERPERVAGLKINEVIEKLALKPSDVVADAGAGPGVFAFPFARAVAPGTVYAVEVDPAFIAHLEKRAKEQQVSNVKPVLGQFEDPKLPGQVDLVFFHDVLHHIEKRELYVKNTAAYVKPGGRIAVIELDATKPDSSHAKEPHLQVFKEQVDQWMAAAGLKKLEDVAMFDDKWFVIYGKAAAK